jgi:predicted AAA+ superfamily ATPase
MEIFDNNDKDILNKGIHNVNEPLDLVTPFRCLIIGRSGVGKTNTIFNIIKKNSVEFKLIYLFHIDKDSHEYDILPHIPYELNEDYLEQFSKYRELNKLLIIDDVDYRNLNKRQQNI